MSPKPALDTFFVIHVHPSPALSWVPFSPSDILSIRRTWALLGVSVPSFET